MKTITIQKDGEKPQVINIPEGAKVIIENGVTLVEPEKYIPKVGDCVRIKFVESGEYGFTEIGGFDKDGDFYEAGGIIIIGNEIHFNRNKTGFIESDYDLITKITNEEYQAGFNNLGYEYDFETHEAKKIKWKPEIGYRYYFISDFNEIDEHIWNNDRIDNIYYSFGNCYRTHDEAIPRQQHYLLFKD
ncbi:MAG: hypothetical protein ACRCV7_00020 [Culicoidibacterales bacterium]